MAFSRRREKERKRERTDRPARRGSRDPFSHLHEERSEAEAGEPWFLGADDGPELHIETGISSNLTEDDLEEK
jgi:hypothetical protein